MAKWIFKALTQGVISFLPEAQRWNRLFQKYVTNTLDPVPRFDQKSGQLRKHLKHIGRSESCGLEGLSVLELGTGPVPFMPVMLFLSGATKVYTFDISPLCRSEDVHTVLDFLCERKEFLMKELPCMKPERFEVLRETLDSPHALSPRELLSRCNVSYEIADAQSTGLPQSSVDLFISNNTLEHIPGEVIRGILMEFNRIASPGAMMSHFIDMSDHYIMVDNDISPCNYLRYPSWVWRFFNNPLHYQNRLRISDYRHIISSSGWEITLEVRKMAEPGALTSLSVAPEFSRYDSDELLTIGAWVTCKMADRRRSQ